MSPTPSFSRQAWRPSLPKPSATSAFLVGGCSRCACRCAVVTRTAQRDEIDKPDSLASSANHSSNATTFVKASSGARDLSSSPLSFGNTASLPVLTCNPKDASQCLNLNSLGDPCLDDSLDMKVFEYLEQMVAGGMTAERAAAVVRQWSSGGGAAMVDLSKLRSYFLRTTLESVVGQHLPPVAVLWSLTWLSYWSLGQLPGADDALLHPALRGALVAVNLLLLVYCASGSLKHSGRLFRVGRAALDFSSRAELVLLALEDLANGHGSLVQAARGYQPPGLGTAGGRRQAAKVPVAAVQRHGARQRVLDACRLVMAFAKSQAGTAAVQPPLAHAASRVAAEVPVAAAAAVGGGTPAAVTSAPLSSLDSFLVLQAAAASAAGYAAGGGGGGAAAEGSFDAAAELGLAAEEVATAARVYARFGDSARGGRIGDYELRRLLQESGAPALSEDERRLALALHSADRRAWLTFRDWLTWWAAAPPPPAQQATARKSDDDVDDAIAAATATIDPKQ